eukprot:CFRG7333T1
MENKENLRVTTDEQIEVSAEIPATRDAISGMESEFTMKEIIPFRVVEVKVKIVFGDKPLCPGYAATILESCGVKKLNYGDVMLFPQHAHPLPELLS